MKKNIFIVEDETDIIELIAYHLKKEGFTVTSTSTGANAFDLIKANKPDLVILDLMLPDTDGFEICKKIKQDSATHHIPIMMVTAKSEDSDMITGLELGAEDYVTKPFSPKVLVARVRTILRRMQFPDHIDKNKSIQIKNLSIDPQKREIRVNDQPITATFSEFQILHLLTRHPGHVFSRYQIVTEIHGEDYIATDRTIDVQIVALRKKLGPYAKFIETIRGVGYRFKE